MTLKMPTDDQLWLSQRARDLAMGINPLFHGTRYPNANGSPSYRLVGDDSAAFGQ
jgi:hypothetical protein